jgi:hypothetical protein
MKNDFAFRLVKAPLSECLKRAIKEISFVRDMSIIQWNHTEVQEWLTDLKTQASRVQISKAKCTLFELKQVLNDLNAQTDVLIAYSNLADLSLEWTNGQLICTLPDELYCRAGVVGKRIKAGFFQISIKEKESKFFHSALGKIEMEYEVSSYLPAPCSDSIMVFQRKAEIPVEFFPKSDEHSTALLDWIGLLAKGYERSVQDFAAKGSFYSTFNPIQADADCKNEVQAVNVYNLKNLLPAIFVKSVLEACEKLDNFAISAFKPESREGIILYFCREQSEKCSLFSYREGNDE